MEHIAATFTMKSWDEHRVTEGDGFPGIAAAVTTNVYTGTISGRSTVGYVLAYSSESRASFVGYEQITGSIDDRQGSFLVESRGDWADGEVTAEWTVVAGTGTGELAGLTGTGHYEARHGEEMIHVELDYLLPGS